MRAKVKFLSQALSCHKLVNVGCAVCGPISCRGGEKAEKPKQRIRKRGVGENVAHMLYFRVR